MAIVAIAVSGGVALFAALVAPIAAHYRQRKALDAAYDRQSEALRAEFDRLSDQLSHDRHVHDLGEVRTRVDEVIGLGEAALSAVCEARLAFNAGNFQAADDQLFQARECLGQYGYKERRVRLLVGNDHELISRLTAFRQTIQTHYELVHGAVSQRTPVPVEAWSNGMAEIGTAQVAVIETAVQCIGARIDSDAG